MHLGETALADFRAELNFERGDEPVGAHSLDAVRDRQDIDAAAEEATLDIGRRLLRSLVHGRDDGERRLGRMPTPE